MRFFVDFSRRIVHAGGRFFKFEAVERSAGRLKFGHFAEISVECSETGRMIWKINHWRQNVGFSPIYGVDTPHIDTIYGF